MPVERGRQRNLPPWYFPLYYDAWIKGEISRTSAMRKLGITKETWFMSCEELDARTEEDRARIIVDTRDKWQRLNNEHEEGTKKRLDILKKLHEALNLDYRDWKYDGWALSRIDTEIDKLEAIRLQQMKSTK